MSGISIKSLTENTFLTAASRLMMAVGLPLVSLIYFYTISKPITDLDKRVTKIEVSDVTQHDQLLKQELLLGDTNRSISNLNDAIKDFSEQLRDLNAYLAVQKDRDAREQKGILR